MTSLLDDPQLGSLATFALGGIGEAARPAAPKLIQRLKTEPREFYDLADTLAAIGAAEAAPALLAAMEEGPRKLPIAARALASLGDAGQAAVPRLIDALQDEALQLPAIQALGYFGERAAPALEMLIRFLDNPDPQLRRQAARTLHSLGPTAASATPRLTELLHGPTYVAVAAADALAGIQTSEAADALIGALQSSKIPTAQAAAQALRCFPNHSEAAAALRAALDKAELQVAAAGGLATHGAGAAAAIPKLIELLSSDSAPRRAAAAQALMSILAADEDPRIGSAEVRTTALRQLLRVYQAAGAYEREVMGEALWAIDPQFAKQSNVEHGERHDDAG